MSDYTHAVVSDTRGGRIIFPPFITQEVMDTLKQAFVPARHDVFVVTYPRSGTTWTEQIVQLLVRRGESMPGRLTDLVPWFETLPNRPGGLAAFLAQQAAAGADAGVTPAGGAHVRLFTSHLPYAMFRSVINDLGRCIYVARNPKDVAVSYYFHDRSKHDYDGSWPEHLDRFMRGKVHFGSYFDHVLPWWRASRDRQNILFLKYETMIEDHRGVVEAIADFLDLNAQSGLIDLVVQKSRFQTMAQDEKTNFSWVPQRQGAPGHYRRGVIGDWRNHFDDEQNLAFDALYADRMKGTGLRFNFGAGVELP